MPFSRVSTQASPTLSVCNPVLRWDQATHTHRRSSQRPFKCCCKQSKQELSAAGTPSQSISTATRKQVFQSCSSVSAVLLAGATAMRWAAPTSSHLLFQQQAEVVQPLLQGVMIVSSTFFITDTYSSNNQVCHAGICSVAYSERQRLLCCNHSSRSSDYRTAGTLVSLACLQHSYKRVK